MKYIFKIIAAFWVLCMLTVACEEKDMSMKMNAPRNIKGVVSYKRSFGDLNDTHMAVAKKIGVKPLKDRAAAVKLGDKVQEIKSGKLYQVDSLTHSIPFLIPKASALLDSIGAKDFNFERVRVFEKHANFIINKGNATAKDVRALMEEVARRVLEQFGVKLESEIRYIK